jgi:hypothetical protein
MCSPGLVNSVVYIGTDTHYGVQCCPAGQDGAGPRAERLGRLSRILAREGRTRSPSTFSAEAAARVLTE